MCVCVCVCFQGLHLRLVQLSDKLGILVISVSCSLVFKFGVFRFLAKLEFSCYSLRYKSAILYTSRVRLYSAHARSRGAHVNLEADSVVDLQNRTQCASRRYVRSVMLHCMHVSMWACVPSKSTAKRPIESRQSDNVRKAARKACETGEETRKRQAQNQERMASHRQSETHEQSMKRQAQNQERWQVLDKVKHVNSP